MGGKRDWELGCSSFILLAGEGFPEPASCRNSTVVQGGSVQSAVGGEHVPLHDVTGCKWRALSTGKLAAAVVPAAAAETGNPLLIVAGSWREDCSLAQLGASSLICRAQVLYKQLSLPLVRVSPPLQPVSVGDRLPPSI